MSTDQAGRVRDVGEREARQVAEEAREAGWQKPSFGKQLYLGDFQLGLIHPHPRPAEEAARRGEEFCARMRESTEPILLVPSTSVVTTTERTFIITSVNGHAHWVDVRKGPAFGDQVAIRGSIQQGERVLKRASDEVREGMPLQ